MSDRVVVITGATGGLGRVVARAVRRGRRAPGARSRSRRRNWRPSPPRCRADPSATRGRRSTSGAPRRRSRPPRPSASASVRRRAPAPRRRLRRRTPFVDGTDEEWSHLIDLNLWTTVHALRAFLPDIAAAEHGRIVTVSTLRRRDADPEARRLRRVEGRRRGADDLGRPRPRRHDRDLERRRPARDRQREADGTAPPRRSRRRWPGCRRPRPARSTASGSRSSVAPDGSQQELGYPAASRACSSMAEQLTLNQRVEGSSPSRLTTSF